MRPAVYIPNFNGSRRLAPVLEALRAQSRPVDVVVADNGSSDDSVELLRERFPEVDLLEMGANLGFGPALNRAVREHPADPLILLNNDAEWAPRFVEALLDAHATGPRGRRGADPGAGAGADRLRRGRRRPHPDGLRPPARRAAGGRRERADPLGPTGGAALYSRAAFEAVGGFDERIFLYYEDLDLALRMAAAGARCRLAPEATAVHAYSASLGAGSGAKFAHTGWSRGYMLRRYGVMARSPRRRPGAGDRGGDLRRPTAARPYRRRPARPPARLA